MKFGLVIFSDFPEGSAPARRLHLIGKGLAGCGHEVHIIVPQRFRPGPLFQKMDGLYVHWGTLATHDGWSSLAARLDARLATFRIISRLADQTLDWLLLSNPGLDGLAYLAAARGRGANIVAMYDDLRARPQHPSMQDRLRLLWLHSADALIPRKTKLNITISHFLEQRIKRIASRTSTFILPPLVDMELFCVQANMTAEFRSRWSLGESTVISYLGTYWRVEGLRVLLEAVSKLTQSGENFKLVISGSPHQGLDCDNVSSLVQQFQLHNVVIETGWLQTSEVVIGMSAADILVAPKLDDIANVAGMPTKLAEYLALGRAVVVSRVGEIPWYVTDRKDAMLCEPGNADALAAVLRELIHNTSLRQMLASNARCTAQQHFDYRQVVGRLAAEMAKLRE